MSAGATVPYYAVTRIGNAVYLLGNQETLANPTCQRVEDPVGSGNYYFKTNFGSIPAPKGTLVYKVVFDTNGVRREYTE